MFKIARSKNNPGTLRDHSEILRIACKSVEVDNPNSEAQLTGRSEQLTFQVDSLLG
jgi:hypothetical protein